MRTISLRALLLLGAAHAAPSLAAAADADTAAGSDIVVTARRNDTARSEEQAAPNLINVQAAEEIVKYPDFNAAESLGRIPGVSLVIDTGEGRFVSIRGIDGNLNGTTFGGVTLLNTNPGGTYFTGGGRAVELDTIPIGAVDRLVVRKTGLPDQEAEGLGGSVELTPRSAAQLKGPFVEGTLGGGYQPAHDHAGIFRGELAAGTKFGPDKAFGIILYGSYHEDHRGFDDLEADYKNAQSDGVPDKVFDDLQLRRYEYNRKRFGFGGELTYDPNPQSHYYIRATDTGYTEKVRKQQFRYSNLGEEFTVDGNAFVASGVSTSLRTTDEQETHLNFVAAAGGHNDFGGVILDYQGAYTTAVYHVLYNYGARFNGPDDLTVRYDNITNPDFPALTLPAGFDPSDATRFQLRSVSNSTERARDREWSGRLDVTIPTHLFGSDEAIKFGGKLRLRDKIDEQVQFDGFDTPSLALSQVRGRGPYTGFYGGRYNIGYNVDYGALEAAQGPGVGTPDPNSFFRDTENVYAGYAQYAGTFGKLGVLAGVRVEHTQGTYRGITQTIDDEDNTTLTPTSRKSSYTDVFPTVQLRYNFTPDLVARASYSTGIGRPGFLQLLSGAQVNLADFTVTVGNPNLKPTTVNAFDGELAYYLPNSGVVSVGVFDKEFKNYVLAREQRGVPFPGYGEVEDTFNIGSFDNAGHSHARGVEAQYVQRFTHLPAPFDGLGVTANLTYVSSRIEIRPGQYQRLPGTAELTWNVGGFYEAHGVQVRIAAQRVGHTLYVVGDGAATDQFESARLTVDLTSSYQITKWLNAYFNVRNLTDAPLRIYEGAPNRPIQREFYDVSYEAGVRFHF